MDYDLVEGRDRLSPPGHGGFDSVGFGPQLAQVEHALTVPVHAAGAGPPTSGSLPARALPFARMDIHTYPQTGVGLRTAQ